MAWWTSLDPAARPRRRAFTAEYTEPILDEYNAFPVGSTERGVLLRREGLYTLHIAEWCKACDACALLGASRATIYRRRRPPVPRPVPPRPEPANTLTEAERQHIVAVLRGEEYCATWRRRRCGPGCCTTASPCPPSPRCTGSGDRRREPGTTTAAHPSRCTARRSPAASAAS